MAVLKALGIIAIAVILLVALGAVFETMDR
jgi:hypothetical protein